MDGGFPGFHLDPTTASPGQVIDLSGYWVGTSLVGTASDGGTVYSVGSLDSDNSGEVRFIADVTAPLSGDDAWIDTPFGFRSMFFLNSTWRSYEGSGMARVNLSRFPGNASTPPYWDFRSVSYTFSSPLPVSENPEPATVLLGLTGLVGMYLRKRWGVSCQ